ncbi:MAG: glycosyltransferase family 52 [Pseudomonadota bacterium]
MIEEERVDGYDLVYVTQNDTNEDRRYFERIARGASSDNYITIGRSRYSLIDYIQLNRALDKANFRRSYDKVIFSSFDNFVLNAVASQVCANKMITCDDGIGGLFESTLFRKDHYVGRDKLYQKIFGALDLGDFKKRIDRHYTLYPGMKNVVTDERLVHVSLHPDDAKVGDGDGKRVFIGFPTERYITAEIKRQIIDYALIEGIDYYIPHPRENDIPKLNAEVVNKNGELAEDIILGYLRFGRPTIIGMFSSVMLNISGEMARRVVVLLRSDARFEEENRIANEAGCEVVVL